MKNPPRMHHESGFFPPDTSLPPLVGEAAASSPSSVKGGREGTLGVRPRLPCPARSPGPRNALWRIPGGMGGCQRVGCGRLASSCRHPASLGRRSAFSCRRSASLCQSSASHCRCPAFLGQQTASSCRCPASLGHRPAFSCRCPASLCRRRASSRRGPASNCRRSAPLCRRSASSCRCPAYQCRRPAAPCRSPRDQSFSRAISFLTALALCMT